MEKLREQLRIGMSQQEVIAVLGTPDHIEEASFCIVCNWDKVVSQGEEYIARIDFTGGRVTSIDVSTPNAPKVELVIVI